MIFTLQKSYFYHLSSAVNFKSSYLLRVSHPVRKCLDNQVGYIRCVSRKVSRNRLNATVFQASLSYVGITWPSSLGINRSLVLINGQRNGCCIVDSIGLDPPLGCRRGPQRLALLKEVLSRILHSEICGFPGFGRDQNIPQQLPSTYPRHVEQAPSVFVS